MESFIVGTTAREEKARLILEECLNLKGLICKDKPDITDYDTIGIEVVQTFEETTCKNLSKQEENNSDKKQKRPVQLAGRKLECVSFSYNNNIHWVEKILFKKYCERFKTKIQKLNKGGYLLFEENDLFMFGNTMKLNEAILQLLIFHFNKFSEGYSEKFKYVFIYENGTLYKLELLTKNINKYKAKSDSQLEINTKKVYDAKFKKKQSIILCYKR